MNFLRSKCTQAGLRWTFKNNTSVQNFKTSAHQKKGTVPDTGTGLGAVYFEYDLIDNLKKNSSAADPGWSRILISIHPGSLIQKKQQKRRGRKIVVLPFNCSHKFHKIENCVIFD